MTEIKTAELTRAETVEFNFIVRAFMKACASVSPGNSVALTAIAYLAALMVENERRHPAASSDDEYIADISEFIRVQLAEIRRRKPSPF